MPRQPKDMSDSPKIGNYKLRSRKKKRKQLEKNWLKIVIVKVTAVVTGIQR